jgi:two-component system, LuxR family, sensor kinase FixL
MTDRSARQVERAAAIVHRLRRFIEKRDAERSPAKPLVLVEDAIALLGDLGGGLELIVRIEPDLPSVLIDRVQIQQVLINLMRNALDAMQDSAKRRLLISAVAPDPGTVLFSLTDTGSGLSNAIAEQLFRPFVSTKKSGMGVGLSICRSIITEHCGKIWAEPNPAGGTIFRFTLPAADQAGT